MRILTSLVAVALIALAGCDAAAPAASADAAAHNYHIEGPSFVRVGDCDTFVIKNDSGVQQSGYNWTVTGGGYVVASSTASVFVGATATPSYTISANVNSPTGPTVTKAVTVAKNPRNTYEC